jgi:exonuclease III
MASYTVRQLMGIKRQLGKLLTTDCTWDRIKSLGLSRYGRGTRAGVNVQRPVDVVASITRSRPVYYVNSVNVNNLIHVQYDDCNKIPTIVSTCINETPSHNQHGCNAKNLCRISISNQPLIRFALLNARSVCNKGTTLCEYNKDNSMDIFSVTETWLNDRNSTVIAEITPPGFSMVHEPRLSGRGGGVAIIHRDSLHVQSSEHQVFKSFDYIERKFSIRSASLKFVVIYRPPPSSKNKLTVSDFMDEFGKYLESLLICSSRLVICGDFNFHLNDQNHPDSAKFKVLLESTGLKQHVNVATHQSGYTLDILLTRESEEVASVDVRDDLISDHSTIFFELNSAKPPLPKKHIRYRKLKSISIDKFKTDILQSGLPNMTGTVDELAGAYSSVLSEILDRHAPLKERSVTIHPEAKWMNDDLKQAKLQKRKAERTWRRTGLVEHKEIYIDRRNILNKMISRSKQECFQQCITESSDSQRSLFRYVDELFNKKKTTILPTHESAEELCNRMVNFFSEKIRIIHEGLAVLQVETVQLDPDREFQPSDKCLNYLAPITEDDVSKTIKQSATKSCCLDPIPTHLVKECSEILLPLITRIINQSFATASVPKSFKTAAVTPILKKANLNADMLKNFRPISNLPFLSKVLEKIASKQMIHHKDTHKLREKMQSAYRKFHSTETALLRIHDDLLLSLDKKQCVYMIMLDLSAAFDTVNHEKLLNRLYTTYGIRGNAHKWVQSYLTDRQQFVTVKGERSKEHTKTCDVPQGSILGPNFYEDYSAVPVGSIFRKHGILFHIYADDTQAYLPFSPGEEDEALLRLERCLIEVRQWMAINWLKLNDTKTEFITFGSKKTLNTIASHAITIGDSSINASHAVKSIGATLDNTLNLEKQIAATCKVAWFHLHNISKIKKYLTQHQLKSIIHAYITSRLDQNNSLLIGLPKKSLTRLQMVQNASARLIMGLRKTDHITPVLSQLHWLPVEKRIIFKVLLLIYKSLHKQGPDYLTELLVPYVPPRTLRSATEEKLSVPKCHYDNTRKRAFSIRGPTEWNKLPFDVKSSKSVDSFKNALKTHLFKQAYYL